MSFTRRQQQQQHRRRWRRRRRKTRKGKYLLIIWNTCQKIEKKIKRMICVDSVYIRIQNHQKQLAWRLTSDETMRNHAPVGHFCYFFYSSQIRAGVIKSHIFLFFLVFLCFFLLVSLFCSFHLKQSKTKTKIKKWNQLTSPNYKSNSKKK